MKATNFLKLFLYCTFFSQILMSHSDESKPSIGFAAIPALSYDSDSGFGYGAVGALYFKEPGFSAFKSSLSSQFLLTTKNLHSHYVQWDQKKAFNLPLRLISKLSFISTNSQNYCGKASDASCIETDAKDKADALGLTSSTKDAFVHHYYQNRLMTFNGNLYSQWLLYQSEYSLQMMLNYKGNYFINGDFKEKGPYKGSLYDQDFKNSKIDGYLSTIELGLMIDARDFEPDAAQGYWLESSVRGGSKIIGSAWEYVGVNAAARFYFPFFNKKLVFASQSIVDSIFGDLNYEAMSKIGGSQSINDYSAIGGKYIGRGIRNQFFVGRFKALEQLEARYKFFSFDLLKQDFDLTAAGFTDLSMTAWDYDRFKKDMSHLYTSFGSGLRISWNKSFVIRADVGFSAHEKYAPKLYLVVDNVF